MAARGRPCPPGCGEFGTCDPLRGVCQCPVTRVGPDCRALALPACAIDGAPLAPTRLTSNWESRLSGSESLGPLTCACVWQLVAMRNLLVYSFPWLGKARLRVQCALLHGEDQTVGALLAAPGRANWTLAAVQFAGQSPVLSAVSPPPGTGSWFRLEREGGGRGRRGTALGPNGFAGKAIVGGDGPRPTITTIKPPPRLVPLSECPDRCGSLGACVHTPAGSRRCECFPPARPSGEGCAPPPASLMPIPGGEGTLSLGRGPPRRPWATTRVGQPLLCPSGCSGVGACDGEGFCRCPAGRWGLDCALGFGGDGTPAVLYTAGSNPARLSIGGGGAADRRGVQSGAVGLEGRHGGGGGAVVNPVLPKIYVHDLPPILRTGRKSFDVEVRRGTQVGIVQI